MHRWMMALLALLALHGCSDNSAPVGSGAGLQGESNRHGSLLAYEHSVTIKLPRDQLLVRFDATREACNSGRFGVCNLLNADENNAVQAYSSLTLRIDPEGVEPLVAFAADGGELTSRNTRSEDLAQSVADTQRQREQLLLQQQTLQQYQARQDLSVSDMLALARELAAVDVQLQATTQEAAQQQRRLQTNLLTLGFSSLYEGPDRLEQLGDAFGDMLNNVTEGSIAALQFVGYGLPFLILLFPLALLVRWLWRVITRRKHAA